jgi:hypothetical protein
MILYELNQEGAWATECVKHWLAARVSRGKRNMAILSDIFLISDFQFYRNGTFHCKDVLTVSNAIQREMLKTFDQDDSVLPWGSVIRVREDNGLTLADDDVPAEGRMTLGDIIIDILGRNTNLNYNLGKQAEERQAKKAARAAQKLKDKQAKLNQQQRVREIVLKAIAESRGGN